MTEDERFELEEKMTKNERFELEVLTAYAKSVAVAMDNENDDELWEISSSITNWALARGLVSMWNVWRRRGSHTSLIISWCIPDDEDVMDYVEALDREAWRIEPGDELLIYRNSRPPDEPWHVVPIQEEPCVNWKSEGF